MGVIIAVVSFAIGVIIGMIINDARKEKPEADVNGGGGSSNREDSNDHQSN